MLWLSLALSMLATKPTLAIVDDSPPGSPAIVAAAQQAVVEGGRFEVRPAEEIAAALADARKAGASCKLDDPPECWARFGLLAEVDRVLVLSASSTVVVALLVDVPARTAARAERPITTNPQSAASDAVTDLLLGRKAGAESTVRGPLFWSGVYVAAFGAVAGLASATSAVAVSIDLANQLNRAHDKGEPLRSDFVPLSATFWVLGALAAVSGVAVVGGAITAGVAE